MRRVWEAYPLELRQSGSSLTPRIVPMSETQLLETLLACAERVDAWPKWKRESRERALHEERLLQEHLAQRAAVKPSRSEPSSLESTEERLAVLEARVARLERGSK